MSNDELKNEQLDADQESADGDTAIEDEQQPNDKQRQSGGFLGMVFAVLLSVLLVAGGAYYWYTSYFLPDQQSLSGKIDALSNSQSSLQASLNAIDAKAGSGDSVDTLVAQQNELSSALNARIDEVAQEAKKVASSQQQLQKSVTSLFEKEDQSSLDWVLAEAEYLVLAANQRLALEGDINTAIAALKAADQRLKSADHPDLIPVRERIIEDATALEAVKLPDIEGLAIYLAQVIEQVKDLPTKAVADSIEPFSSTKNLQDEAKNWRNVANAMWTDLVELVEVKDAALPDSVAFDPELRYFLQQNLRLELASARLSVLRRDGQNFRASVSLIKDMLNEFYETSATQVSSIIERLNAAEAYEFEPALPKITASLDVIRAYMKKSKSSGAGQ